MLCILVSCQLVGVQVEEELLAVLQLVGRLVVPAVGPVAGIVAVVAVVVGQ